MHSCRTERKPRAELVSPGLVVSPVKLSGDPKNRWDLS